VEVEHRTIATLTEQIELLRGSLLKHAKATGGVHAARESARRLERQVKVLENRLEKALVRFNEALAANRELRGQIDALRQERSVFEGVLRKLEKEIVDKKRATAALIETANQSYEGRDRAAMEISRIQQEVNAERLAFEAHLAAMDAAIDADTDAARAAEVQGRGSLSMEEEEELKSDLKQGQRDLARDATHAREVQQKVEAYEAAFTRIKVRSRGAGAGHG
jgi:chromosome segregation ATPase